MADKSDFVTSGHFAEHEDALRRIHELERALNAANEHARDDRKRYQSIITTAMDGYCLIDADGFVLEVNDIYCRMLGFSCDELVDMHVSSLDVYEDEEAIRMHCETVRSKKHVRFETRHRRKDGGVVDVEVSAQYRPEEGQVITFIRDVSRRKEVEETLRANERKWRSVLQNTPQIGLTLDTEGRLTFVNDFFCTLTGWKEHEVLGADWFSLCIPPELREEIREVFHETMNSLSVDGSSSYENEIVVKDGSRRKIAWYSVINKDTEDRVLNVTCLGIDLTERVRAENELKASEENLRKALERLDFHIKNSPLAVVEWDSRGTIVGWSSKAEEFFGWKADEVLGKNWGDWDFIHPDDKARVEGSIGGLFTGEDEYNTIENRNLTADGRVLSCRWHNSALREKDGRLSSILSQVEDVTERVAVQEELKKSEDRLRAMFENMGSGVAVFAPLEEASDFELTAFNPSAEAITNVSADQVVGKRLLESFPDADRTIFYPALKRVAETGCSETLEPFFYEDDLRRGWREAHLYSLPSGEIVTMFDDVSERVAAREALLKAKEEAESANRAKSEFLANMSHEIRTPLNGIMGMLQLMNTTKMDEEQQEYVQAALKSSERLGGLLSDILDISRVEASKLVMEQQPFDIRDTVERIRDLFFVTARQSGLSFTCRVAEDMPSRMIGDALRLQQILTNIVGNAFKFTKEGQISLDVSVVSHEKDSVRVLAIVQDTGIGIAEEMLETVFQSFTQASGGYTRSHQGAGLGLAICKRLVNLMGGSINVDSVLGQGTTIAVSIPFALHEEDVFDVCPTVAEKNKVQGRKILLVEDDALSRRSLSLQLQHRGHTVTAIENGQLALDALLKDSYDVVLMDIQMPVMNGVEAAKAIRSGRAGVGNGDIPIVAMTAYAMQGDRERFLQTGMNDYIAKPIDFNELQKSISTVLEAGA